MDSDSIRTIFLSYCVITGFSSLCISVSQIFLIWHFPSTFPLWTVPHTGLCFITPRIFKMGLPASYSIVLFSLCIWSKSFCMPYALCLMLTFCTSLRAFAPSLSTESHRALFPHTDLRAFMPSLDKASHTCPLSTLDVFSCSLFFATYVQFIVHTSAAHLPSTG